MAQRERDKSKRPAERASETMAGLKDAVQRLELRAKALERERDGLKDELEAARARIAMLEETRDQTVSRIGWIIESLHDVSEKRA